MPSSEQPWHTAAHTPSAGGGGCCCTCMAGSRNHGVRVNACRGEPVDRPLSKRWILWSALGIVWGGTHVGLEALMGKGLFRLGVLLTLAWAVLLVLAVKRQRWAKHGAVLLGALEIGRASCRERV